MRAAFIAAVLVGAAGLAWTVALAVDPDPFAPSSALALAVGLVVYSVIAIAALLLGRTRWSRWLGVAVLSGGAVLGIVTGFDLFRIVALTLSGLAVVALTGPWLDLWLRRTASVDGPGPRPTALVLGTLVLVPAVGIASPHGLAPAHGVLAGVALLASWGYARAGTWALWGMRIVIPAAAIAAAASSPLLGAIFLVAIAAALTWLAWSGEAQEALVPRHQPDQLADPERRSARPDSRPAQHQED